MPKIFIEINPQFTERTVPVLLDQGLLLVSHYRNISVVMGSDILVFDAPQRTKLRPFLTIPGIIYLEPNEEHSYALLYRDEMPFGTRFMALPPVQLGIEAQSSLPEILNACGFTRAWDRSRGEGVVIAVNDSGIDGRRIPTESKAGGYADDGSNPWTDEFGHGTGVGVTLAMAAPAAKIFSAKMAVGPKGGMTKYSVLSAVDHMIPIVAGSPQTKFVLNCSWASDCDRIPYH